MTATNRSPIKMKKTNNINFEKYVSNAPDDIERRKLVVEGKIPSYVKGTLMRNGPALWSVDNSGKPGRTEIYDHYFDGLAKITSYEIDQKSGEGGDLDASETSVHFQTRFIQSNVYKKIVKSKKLQPILGLGAMVDEDGNMKTRILHKLQAVANLMQYDNSCVNVWNYNTAAVKKSGFSSIDKVVALTDAPFRAEIATNNLDTISTSTTAPFAEGKQGYELSCVAHPEYSKIYENTTYNVGVEIGLCSGYRLILTKETDTSRSVIGRSKPLHANPYVHSFAVTGRYAIVVLQPLAYNLGVSELIKVGIMRAQEQLEFTQIIVFDVETGECVLDETTEEKVFFYHTISATEERDDENDATNLSVRLCAYRTSEYINGEDHFLRLNKCLKGKKFRNRIPKGGAFCEVTCNLKTKAVGVNWKGNESAQGFELPTTRYSRASGESALISTHPRYVYGFGTYADGSDEYDSWGLFKYDTEQKDWGVVASYSSDSVYLSESIFVPDPDGEREDDGVLLTPIFDGKESETALLVLDATDLSVLATAWTGQRSPMDFHGTWFPSS